MKGRITVITFVHTWDMASLAQINFLIPMAKRDGHLVNYIAIVVQPMSEKVLAEMYRDKLQIPFPVGLLGEDHAQKVSPFGSLDTIPMLVLLDRGGRIVWVKAGVAQSKEIRNHMRAL